MGIELDIARRWVVRNRRENASTGDHNIKRCIAVWGKGPSVFWSQKEQETSLETVLILGRKNTVRPQWK